MRLLLATLATAILLAGSTHAQTYSQLLDQTVETVEAARTPPVDEASQLLDEAVELIGKAKSTLNAPDPDPDPDPEPPTDVVAFPSKANPWELILLPVDEFPSRHMSSFDSPKIDGISARASHAMLEPKEGQYNFALLDKCLAECKKRNKLLTIRPMFGDPPGWLPQKGGYPDITSERVLLAEIKLLTVLGQRYSGEPLVKMVHVPGCGDSAEMHVPAGVSWTPAQSEKWWCAMIDATAAAFPKQIVCLNHSPEKFSAPVVQWFYSRPNLVGRAGIQMNSLKANTITSSEHYDVIKRLDAQGKPVGFQYACPSTNVKRFGSPFIAGRNKGVDAGARWFENYEPDVTKLP